MPREPGIIQRQAGESTDQRRSSRFIFKHKKWISFLGLLIVLGTYLAKETWLDKAKASADSIESTRKEFALEKQTILLRKEQFSLMIKMESRGSNQPSPRPRTPRELAMADVTLVDTYVDEVQRVEMAVSLLDDEFQSGKNLASSFPEGSSIKSVKDAELALADEKEFLRNLSAQIEEFDESIGNPKGYAAIRQKTIDLYLSGGYRFQKALESTDAMCADVLTRADAAYQASIRRISSIKLRTLLLFLVGWSLSLVDKLYLENKDDSVGADTA